MARWNPGRLAVEVIAGLFVVAGVLGVSSDRLGAPIAATEAVHLALGLTGLAAARSPRGGRVFLLVGGVVFFLWHFGASAPIELSTTDDLLNLWLAISMIALACLVGDRRRPARAASATAAAPSAGGEPVELSVSWRQVRGPAAYPTAHPRRPRPAAGSRPPAPGRGAYRYGV